jgi:hypothetical protein
MFKIKDSLFRSTERAMQAVYRPAIEIIMVYGFRLVVIAGRALKLLPTPPIVPPRPKRVLVINITASRRCSDVDADAGAVARSSPGGEA